MVAKAEKKDEKTSLGSKILDYVPWRTALTVAALLFQLLVLLLVQLLEL
ncbi:hypothetical protein WCLE_008190 [Wolbachia endosymbiont of Cimex lectularius]|nr:hypothetical protein WCLE_008190 [Wolbachia endosymbiont of Cimex lectularius]